MAWITSKEAAALADTHPNYINQIGQRGLIKRKVHGNIYLFWDGDVSQWAMSRRGPKNPGKYRALPKKPEQLLLAAPSVSTPIATEPQTTTYVFPLAASSRYLVQINDSFDEINDLDTVLAYVEDALKEDLEATVWERVSAHMTIEVDDVT